MPDKIVPMSLASDPRLDVFGITLEALTRLTQVLDRSLKAGVGMGLGWLEALLRLERSGGRMTMGCLAGEIALTSGGVTRLVDRLAAAGLAERRACAEDRRVLYVAITQIGRERLGEALAVHLEDLDREFNHRMSEEEAQALRALMDRMRKSPVADKSLVSDGRQDV